MTVDPHEHPELDNNIEEVAAAVLGPRKSEFAGGGRYDEAGLIYKVAETSEVTTEILRKLNNGGIKIKLPVSVWVAIIAALGGLGVQLIDSIWGMP
jgi:hypothetical protein